MGDFSAPKLDKVRLAFIGVGARGTGHAKQLATIKGTEVVAICDLYKDLAERSKRLCLEADNKRHKNLKIYFDNPKTLAKTFQLRGVPTTILINKDGLEFARIMGSIDFNNQNFIKWLSDYN